MTPYAAFFRGLNVGGKHAVPMAALRRLLTGIGLSDVSTYIQSGNVMFRADEPEAVLCPRIDQAFADAFGFDGAVRLRTADELDTIADHLPFSGDEIDVANAVADAVCLYVFLYADPVDSDAVKRIAETAGGADQARVVGRELYLLLRQNTRNSKLAQRLQAMPGLPTARNWNTLMRVRACLI